MGVNLIRADFMTRRCVKRLFGLLRWFLFLDTFE